MAALLVVLSAATEDEVVVRDLVDVAIAKVLVAATDDDVASAALAFLLPQVAASLQARWPVASLG